jgi:hypothetical protein
MKYARRGSGGPGGHAEATGDDSNAVGGPGGEGVIGNGGPGGSARVYANRSVGIGGPGGRAGVGDGQPGGDVFVEHNDTYAAGGGGGESSQMDGRGGRGGLPGGPPESVPGAAFERRRMKLPYGRENAEPGRGGDAADSLQYKARKLIIMDFKKRYFVAKSIAEADPDHIWYDREIVPLEWLNKTLEMHGFQWRVSVVALEYEFADIVS